MKIFEDIIIEDSIEVNAKPEVVFKFIASLADNESYCKWHPKDRPYYPTRLKAEEQAFPCFSIFFSHFFWILLY